MYMYMVVHTCANCAVVGTLRAGVAELIHGVRAAVERSRSRCRPTHRAPILEESVLLLDTEPRNLLRRLLENGVSQSSGGLLDGSHVWEEHFAEHENVVALAHRVLAHERWLQEDLRIRTGGLFSTQKRLSD